MAQHDDDDSGLDLTVENTATLLLWAGLAGEAGAYAEVMIGMRPTDDPAACYPVVYTRPGGPSVRDLVPLLRYLADEIEAGRMSPMPASCTPAGVEPKVPVCGPWGGAICLQCGGVHGPQEPCADTDF